MASLAIFFGHSDKWCNSKMPFRPRLDLVFQRCRLIILMESVRIVNTLVALSQQSRHTAVMVKGLRALTIDQAEHQILEVANIIVECQQKRSKRLECEARLLQACYHLILRELKIKESSASIEESMREAQNLCLRYPDTAGLLLPAYRNINRSLTQLRGTVNTFYEAEFQHVWWMWPKHQIGALEQCLNGHLYSSLTWSYCPECGREVERPKELPLKPLQDLEFRLAMKASPVSFDGAAYRRR